MAAADRLTAAMRTLSVPESKHDWRGRMSDRDEMLKQARTDQRYWYSESYGSEKRKKPA